MEMPFFAAFMIFMVLLMEGDREAPLVPLFSRVFAGSGRVLAPSVNDSSSC